jgi:hypothetical protein
MSQLPPPVCVAMLLADAITTDPVSKKLTVHGVFSQVVAAQIPVSVALSLYAELTDGHGSYEMAVRFVDLRDDDVIFQAKQPLSFDDPRVTAELVLIFDRVTFPRAGDYRVQLWTDEQFVAERRLTVRLPAAN